MGAGAALAAAVWFAAVAGASSPRWVVGAHGGYRVGGHLDNVRYDPYEAPLDLEVDQGFEFGGQIAWAMRRNIYVGLRFDRQNTDLRVRSVSRDAGIPLTVDHIHAGFTFAFPQPSLTPLLSFSLGSTFLRPGGDRETLDRFSWAVGVGAERTVAPRVGVRAETRIVAVFLDSNDSAFCGAGTYCYNYALSTWLWQGEATLGLVVGF